MGTPAKPPLNISSDDPADRLSRTWRLRILTAAVCAYIVLALATCYTRLPWGDEGFFAAPAFSLVSHGYLGTPMIREHGMDRFAYSIPPLHYLVQAAWYKLAGYGVLQMRMPAVFWGLMVILCWMLVVDRLSRDRWVAVVTGSLLALDYTFLMHATNGRPDMMSEAFGIGGLALYLCLRDRHLGRALLLSHTAMMISGLTHPVGGVIYELMLLFLMARLDWRRWWTPKMVVLIAVPYLIGMAGWGLYIAQNPAAFQEQFFGVAMSMNRLAGFTSPMQAVMREFTERYFGYYSLGTSKSKAAILKALLPMGYLAAIVLAVAFNRIRRQPLTRRIGVLLAIGFTTLAVIDGTKQKQYITYLIPFAVGLIAIAIVSVWRQGWKAVAVGIAVIVLGVQVLPVLYRISLDPYHRSFLPLAAQVRHYAGAGRLVTADLEWGLVVGITGQLSSDTTLGARDGRVPDVLVANSMFEEFWDMYRRTRPDIWRHVENVRRQYQEIARTPEYTLYVQRSLVEAPQPEKPRSSGSLQ